VDFYFGPKPPKGFERRVIMKRIIQKLGLLAITTAGTPSPSIILTEPRKRRYT